MTQEHEEEMRRAHLLYSMLIEQLVVGSNTIHAELEKPKGEQDVYYIMAQQELSITFENAATAMENNGMVDEAMFLCHCCGDSIDSEGHAGPEKPMPN